MVLHLFLPDGTIVGVWLRCFVVTLVSGVIYGLAIRSGRGTDGRSPSRRD